MKTLRNISLVALAALSLLAASAARAAGPLTAEVFRTVTIIKSSMSGSTDIKLGSFEDLSLSKFSGSISPLILEEFKAAFTKENIILNDNAAHILTGQFLVSDAESINKGDPLQLTIKLGLVNRRGQRPVELLPIFTEGDPKHFLTVNSTQDLAKAVGGHGKITSDLEFQKERNSEEQVPVKQRQQELAKLMVDPHGHISGKRIHSVAGSPYEIEVLSRPVSSGGNYNICQPRLDDGLPWVDLEINDVYAIKIYNNSDKDVAVNLSIDGLSVFHFAEKEFRKDDGSPQFSYYIVHPKGYKNPDGSGSYDGTLTVLGWFQRLKAPDNILSFLITEYGKGASSKAGFKSSTQVGVIHAQFSNCFLLPPGQGARSGKETGFGPPQSQNSKAVSYEMEPPHEFISIRYDKP